MNQQDRFKLHFLEELVKQGKSRPVKEVRNDARAGVRLPMSEQNLMIRAMHKDGWIQLKKNRSGTWNVRLTSETRKQLRKMRELEEIDDLGFI